ncbi:tubulin polyglutamylase ttll6-like isoform X1 [Clavelina lepadiformis]|uniref:tubulin polyglutamylase ttll6-like isoform X1 n=1 Tax=Clavelina lepadiformis TaxID=159417 RepID=UPI004042B2BA
MTLTEVQTMENSLSIGLKDLKIDDVHPDSKNNNIVTSKLYLKLDSALPADTSPSEQMPKLKAADSQISRSSIVDTSSIISSSLLMYQTTKRNSKDSIVESSSSATSPPSPKIASDLLCTEDEIISNLEAEGEDDENDCNTSRSKAMAEGILEVNGEVLGEDLSSDVKKSDEAASITCSSPSRKKKKKKKKWIGICTTNCKYDSVRRMSRRYGMKEVGEDEEWAIFWTDYSVSLDRVMEMKRFQKINHFPGMNEICRKDFLARNLNRLHKLFPKEYNCFPKTWCFPADFSDFQAYCRSKKNKTFICKPESGCQGRGIFLTKNAKDIKPGEHMICQQYVNKCLTIDGFKFDFRLYVLVTSCDPLRIFMYKEGLGRFATKKYCEPTNHNLDEVCMHLTNYAINKNSDDFIRDDVSGSKRKIATVCQWLDEHGYDVPKMWASIEDVVIKTLISAHPILKHNYRTCFPNHVRGSACFEILGFDVMLDKKMKAWVLEVNHSPSFHTDAKLDKEVKEGLLLDTLNLLDLRSVDRKKCLEEDRRRVKERLISKPKSRESRLEEIKTSQQQYQESLEKYENDHLGGFRRIYPAPGYEKYNQYFENSCSLFQMTAAAKAREEAAKAQREEIRMKQEKREAMLKGRPYRPDLKKEAGESGGERKLQSGIVPFRHRPVTRQLTTLTRQISPELGASIDTSKPVEISEDEELERISGLLQRDSLIRSLGVVEQVHRLLHCTPGTTGITKSVLPQEFDKVRHNLELQKQLIPRTDDVIPPIVINSTFRGHNNAVVVPLHRNPIHMYSGKTALASNLYPVTSYNGKQLATESVNRITIRTGSGEQHPGDRIVTNLCAKNNSGSLGGRTGFSPKPLAFAPGLYCRKLEREHSGGTNGQTRFGNSFSKGVRVGLKAYGDKERSSGVSFPLTNGIIGTVLTQQPQTKYPFQQDVAVDWPVHNSALKFQGHKRACSAVTSKRKAPGIYS